MEKYKEEYDEFLSNYSKGQTSADDIGEMIVRLAQYYADKNTLMGVQYGNLNAKAAEFIIKEDEQTGKPISAVKAETLTKATEEATMYDKSRRDVQNIEQMINALKSLQKGVMNEYSHVGGA